MKKHILNSLMVLMALILMALPCASWAVDGKVAFGKFFDAENVRAWPDGGLASYRSEIEIGHRMGFLTGQIRPYLNLVTLMDKYADNGGLHPASINYTVGLGWQKQLSGQVFFFTTLKHFCWHPVDRRGTVEQANYVEIGFGF